MERIIVILILSAIPLISNADLCSEKLLEKDFVTGSSFNDQRSYDYSLICILEFDEFEKSKGASAEASFIKVTGSADYSESSYNKYKRESCHIASKNQLNSSMVFYAHKVLSSEAIQGYVACKRNEVFGCWVEPQGDSNAAFTVSRGTQAPNYVTDAGVIIDGNVTVLDNPLSEGSQIKYGLQSVVIRRNDKESVYFSINVSNETGIVGNKCQAYIAKEFEMPKVTCAEQYNTKIDFDGDGCMDRWINNNNSLLIELGNGKSFPISLSEKWRSNNGVWLEGDFDGDSRTDLIQIVNSGVEHPDYAHAICKINSRNDYLNPPDFNFKEKANKEGNYCVSCGPWSVVNANNDKYSDLQHNSNIGNRMIHKWISTGKCGTFVIR